MATTTSHDTHIADLAIKLFGRTIPLPDSQISLPTTALQNLGSDNNSCRSGRSDNEGNRASNITNKEESDPKEEQERVLKKPDKIIPCPRCNSLETKFCYFNNYNVNQPRHFCKNCQRYWTAGGTMRNVPIGAGRRRNKQLASQYRQIIVSSEGVGTSESTNHHQLLSCVESSSTSMPPTGNGTVLKFGPEAPIGESMETVLSLGDQKRCRDSPEEPSSCGSSMTTTSIRGSELSGSCGEIAASNTVHCYPVPQLVFPVNQGSGGSGTISPAVARDSNGNLPSQVQWLPATMVAVPGFCTPSLPVQFVPAAASCWSCAPVWTGSAGNLAAPATGGSTSSSSVLGKHSRDSTDEENSEKCIVVPKTLRVDNPNEASRSPIWATLGIRPNDAISRGTTLETLDTNGGGKGHFMGGSPRIVEAKTSNFYSIL